MPHRRPAGHRQPRGPRALHERGGGLRGSAHLRRHGRPHDGGLRPRPRGDVHRERGAVGDAADRALQRSACRTPACRWSAAATAPTSWPTPSSPTTTGSSRTPSPPPSTRCPASAPWRTGLVGRDNLVPVQIPRLAMTNRQLDQVADADHQPLRAARQDPAARSGQGGQVARPDALPLGLLRPGAVRVRHLPVRHPHHRADRRAEPRGALAGDPRGRLQHLPAALGRRHHRPADRLGHLGHEHRPVGRLRRRPGHADDLGRVPPTGRGAAGRPPATSTSSPPTRGGPPSRSSPRS